jgi:hypothetical protein
MTYRLTPWERAVGYREQISCFISFEPEGIKKSLFLAHNLLGYQLSYAYHLVTVTGVGNEIAVLFEYVKDREIIR